MIESQLSVLVVFLTVILLLENLMQVRASFNFIHLWFIMDLCCQNTFFMDLSKEKLGKVNKLNPILYFFKRDQLKL